MNVYSLLGRETYLQMWAEKQNYAKQIQVHQRWDDTVEQ